MSSLLLRKKNTKRSLLAEEIWTLCQHVCPKIYKDMQRVALMKAFDPDYFEKEFRKVSDDFALISVFGVQLDHPNELSWNSVKSHWLELRNIVAKYLGEEDSRIIDIDNRYNLRLKLKYLERPADLRRDWWDSHPNREASLENIAVNWWRMTKVPPCKFEDLAANSSTYELSENINDIQTATLSKFRS
jgi:hypothetical protein